MNDEQDLIHARSQTPAEAPKPPEGATLNYVSRFTMKDGTEVTLRPIRPDDEPLMVQFHQTLSDRTVYMRYFCSLPLRARVAHDRLVQICFVDFKEQFALVADHQVPATGEHHILGVGRLMKVPSKDETEVALLVSDQCQGQGLGAELLRRAVAIARATNLHRISAEMLQDNLAVLSVFKSAGFRLSPVAGDSSIAAVLDL